MPKEKVYIAGPMTGHKYFNFPAFDEARDFFKAHGYKVISPADIDRAHGFDGMRYPSGSVNILRRLKFSKRDAARRDLIALSYCRYIHMLPGWETSSGARAEHEVSLWLGIPKLSRTDVQESAS